jgi:predicted HicB family RNase H-like nuclease
MKSNSDNNRETTSIRVDPSLWKEAKLLALKNDMSIGEFIEGLIKKEMSKK